MKLSRKNVGQVWLAVVLLVAVLLCFIPLQTFSFASADEAYVIQEGEFDCYTNSQNYYGVSRLELANV